MSDTLQPGQWLTPDTGLTSGNGRYSLWLQSDGNLVLYNSDGIALWASRSGGFEPDAASMQEDGNLVIYDTAGTPRWSSGSGVPGSSLVVQNDGNVVIYTPDGVPVWATNTASNEPIEPGPEPEPGGPDDATIFILTDQQNRPVGGVLISSDGDPNARMTDGSGFCHFPSTGIDTYTFTKEGYVTRSVSVGQGVFTETFEAVRPAHPDPVQGRIRVDHDSFADDSGKRTFAIMHAGDFVPRWMAAKAVGNTEAIAKILSDLDDVASAGYHVIRTWWHLRAAPPSTPWAHGGDPNYNGCDALAIPGYVGFGVEFANEVAARGMRAAIGSGGIDKMAAPQEAELMRQFRRVIDGAGAEKFAWTEPINEPASTHATSDDDGDNEPTYLRSLSRIMTDGTGILWHLGGVSNTSWDTGRFGQKFYTPADQPTGYTHPYRAGRVWDKIRHWFSWPYETAGHWKRLWILGEVVGQPTSGPPLRYVSATANGHELTAEALALLAATGTLRGMCGSMSGNGVQRYQSFTNVVGFREIPWLISKLPRDVNTFQTYHHSGESFRRERVIPAQGLLRVDGSIHSDGRFAYVIYGPSGSYTLRVEKGFTGVLYNPADMTEQAVSIPAGGTLHLAFAAGRLLVGHLS